MTIFLVWNKFRKKWIGDKDVSDYEGRLSFKEVSRVKNLFYSWMVVQILVGVWLFFSPFVFGEGETHIATINMIFGAIVGIFGVGSFFYEFYHKERSERESLSEMEHAKQRV